MRLGSGESGVNLALLSRLGSASGTTNIDDLFVFDFHDFMVQRCPEISWSIVTALRFAADLESDGPVPNTSPNPRRKMRLLVIICNLRKARASVAGPSVGSTRTPQV